MSVAKDLERVATDVARRLDPVTELEQLVIAVAQLEHILEEAQEAREKATQRAIDAEEELAAVCGDEDVMELIADHQRGLIDTDELYERTVGR